MGLSPLGTVHTAIALVAVVCAIFAFYREGTIPVRGRLGRTYVVTTIFTCVTAFGIFRHGGFGIAHVLAVLTLVAIAVAVAADGTRLFGNASRYVVTAAMTTTFFFHTIPGVVETSTRLPARAPLFENDQAPGLQLIVAGLFGAYLIGIGYQILRMRAAGRLPPGAGNVPG